MKKLHITRKQAFSMAQQLEEYALMTDSSDRWLFKGFEISFGDPFVEEMQPDDGFEITPIPEFLEVEGDKE